MGAPPTINLIREVFIIIVLLNTRLVYILFIRAMSFIAACFTMVLYNRRQVGQKSFTVKGANYELRFLLGVGIHAIFTIFGVLFVFLF